MEADQEAGAGSLVAVFSGLEDPRVADNQRHRLSDILVIAFCTVLCGREEFTAMEGFGIAKEGWLRGFLELPFGIPSHDTLRTVLSALDAKQLAQALITWSEGVRQKLARPEIVASDGKSARRRIAKGTLGGPAPGQHLGGGQHLVPGSGADQRKEQL